MTFLVVATLAVLCLLLLGLPAVLFALMVETARQQGGTAILAGAAVLPAPRLQLGAAAPAVA